MQLCARAGVCSVIDYIRIMNVRFIVGLLAVGWLFSQPARAEMADNPYQPIVTRNVFALVPIPTNVPVDPSSLIPPPKITPNGIMTLFGNVQVLFKVAGVARPGMPPKDESYVMSVGDREDDIEVEKIDEKTATITFNNHGSIQELGLTPATDSGGGIPGAPGYGQPGMGRGPGGFGRFGHSQNNPSYPSYPNANSAPVTVAGSATTANDPSQQPLTPEAQVILLEAQRMQWQKEGDNAAATAVIPPTELTPLLNGEGSSDGGDAAPEPAPGN